MQPANQHVPAKQIDFHGSMDATVNPAAEESEVHSRFPFNSNLVLNLLIHL